MSPLASQLPASGMKGVIGVFIFSILVVPENVRAMTANLQAPVIMNPRKRIAKQVILTDERFPLRFPVFGGTGTIEQGPGRRRSC